MKFQIKREMSIRGKSMKRKWLAVGIILLFVGTSIIPATAQNIEKQSSRGNWLYVGGSGPGNYSVIQEAVDNASDGDTVFVYHGTYNQNPYSSTCVNIFKSISLIGEDKNTTIINGIRKWDVVRVLTDRVNISGFTIQNCGTGTYPGAGVHIYNPIGISDINVHDNIIENNSMGMTMYYCHNTCFFNNIFINNDCGCIVDYSSNCSIHHNLFINNGDGIEVTDEGSIDIYHNEFKNNEKGVYCTQCKGVTIRSNNFIDNNVQATYLNSGSPFYLFHLLKYKQNWNSNYWSDWQQTKPKRIRGTTLILIGTGLPLIWIPIPLPSFDYDRTPTQEPYDIPGMS
jgi:parallel beta-helix repeat protein